MRLRPAAAGIATAALFGATLAAAPISAFAQIAPAYPVGIRQVEYVDAQQGGRHLALWLFYPAAIDDRSATPFVMPFFTNLELYQDAEMAQGDARRPLVMFSHGRGSNGLYYAWFAEFLAARGYIVAALDHYRANSYDATIAYLANKLWQRPVDIGLGITFLLEDPFWGSRIDPDRIGVAGHSQGGFTALWVGGAKVDPDRYLGFQRRWRDNLMVPEYLRSELPLDARPALDVHDQRVKAVFAMAPGVIQAFGMDEAGLRELSVPTYIIVGAADTQTPPEDNAEFAARYVPNAELDVLPGRVDHEIFVNECNEIGRDEFPEACIDAPGVDRTAIHQTIGDAAVRFFDGALQVTRPN
ncbi:MAG: alpha/beta hydrolase family protein [Geminicoccaceae bacterium]